MRLSPTARGVVAATAFALLLCGCGSTDEPRTSPATTPPPSSTITAATPTPTPTPTRSSPASPSRPATPATTPAPTKTATVRGGGEDTGSGTTKAPKGAVCARVVDRDIATVLGTSVTRSSFSGGCTFAQSDSAAPTATLEQTRFTGMQAAHDDVTSAVEGSPQPVSIGDEAFVVTGTMFGGTDIQGGGAVRLGSRLVKVTVEQHQGLARAKVRRLVVDLLRLAARG